MEKYLGDGKTMAEKGRREHQAVSSPQLEVLHKIGPQKLTHRMETETSVLTLYLQ